MDALGKKTNRDSSLQWVVVKPAYQSHPATDSIAEEESDLPEHSADVRLGRDLLQATRAFASESAARSWWHVGSTFALMITALTGAGLAGAWPLRTALGILGALLMVRAFITYHDFMHGAILRESRLASIFFHVYGVFALVPPRSWKKSHNYHHGHVGQISAVGIGSFPIITMQMWRQASTAERARYRIIRHPLTVLFGYVTVFAVSICLMPLLRDPRKHWDSVLSLLAHGGLIAVLWVFGGFDTAFFAVLLPMTLASTLGAYLFFAQHSFKRMIILSPEAWTFYRAALKSSSYMRLNRLMQWFTGNIGYHHLHHLATRVPNYRLRECFESHPRMQQAPRLTLRSSLRSARLRLWDEQARRLVPFSALAATHS